ncbi:SagB/ThcOx family dehydrogenase [Bacillus atrophaeus]|uniref:SagB/ThcOx family dehydrogenase n=1 Tax=Bacillus atrophaeus TaxID=1452 RepID=UPI002282AE1D|nr:SagB/ThcOx family dehydrogenase [Bacillus atrophaeus]MCY9135877.1 SagB/ThcOx family dehydrogenase [Bacillus atrophaeus]
MNKYFWAPNIQWRQEDNEIIIGELKFKGKVIDFFPEIYFEFQKGIFLNELPIIFQDFNIKILKMFVRDLIRNRVLIDSTSTPNELFKAQNQFVYNDFEEGYFLKNENINEYRNNQLNRFSLMEFKETIPLNHFEEIPSFIRSRKSTRDFDSSKTMSFSTFSNILGVFQQTNIKGNIQYFYPSAGGLYPVNIYLYIKKNRVENIEEGLYLYKPSDNSINLVGKVDFNKVNFHYFMNDGIFKQSTFTVFYTLDNDAIIPKYGGNGYYYGLLEAGVMTSLLSYITEFFKVGSCSIGDIKFDELKEYFKFKRNEVFLHTVEVGMKK